MQGPTLALRLLERVRVPTGGRSVLRLKAEHQAKLKRPK
jgi:hypothetical protein